MLKISPLFSGSSGNCALVQADGLNILLDAGYHYKQIISRLADFDITLSDISAIVITHEHTDHIAALPYITRGYNTAVYAPKEISDYVCQRSYCSNVFPVDGAFDILDVKVDVYQCSHDARACVGYRFGYNGESVASVTDTGRVDGKLAEFLSPCKGIMLESNHDVNMLLNGPYHYVLKRRILSDFGHLSNAQTAQVITALKGSNVKQIALAHLSEQNNTKELAFSTAVHALHDVGLTEGKDVKIFVTDQYSNRITLC